MGSAVENVENAAFVDRIKWSRKMYALRMLLEFHRPPCIVSIPEGYKGSNDVENLAPGLIVRIHSVFAEKRVFARCADGRVFSIPESFPIKFEVVKKKGKRGKAKRLDEILRDYRPPIVVVLDRKNNRWAFRNGKLIQSEDSLGTMVLFKAYFEYFARVNQLVDGAIDRHVYLIPLYMDLDVRLAEGLKNENSSEFTSLVNMYGRAVGSIDYSAYTSLNAILQFDPSVGSTHPLASSQLPSRTNSTPGINFFGDSQTVTDEPTLRSSLASGSQGRSTRGRSEDPRQRRRAQSEDFEGALTLERGGNRVPVKSEVKDIKGSTDRSLFGGSSGQDLELTRRTATEAQLSRRRGRSAEELQARPTRNDATLESASLDHLPDAASQATISRRSEIQNVRHAKENQTGNSRGTGGREEGQAQGDGTLTSDRSRSRNPVVTHPMPKPRASRSGKQSDDSSLSVRPAPHRGSDGRGQSSDRSVVLNPSQGWSSSPAPNYHIHINIQSPNSPPTQQWSNMPTVDVNSTPRRTAALTAAPTQPDNGYVDAALLDEPVGQTFLRQGPRPQKLPQPVAHTYLTHESREPKLTETMRHTNFRHETYPPKGAESVRHAYVRHVVQTPMLSETVRPSYNRQETYPKDNARWNSNSSRRVFRDVFPTMQFRSAPFDRRSTSARMFVSSVSCSGDDSLDPQTKNDFVDEGRRSHRLSSKVIRLKGGDESEIAEMEVKEFYGRTSTIRTNGSYVKPNVEYGDVNNNSMPSSGKYPNQLPSSRGSNPRSRLATNIEIPFTLDMMTMGVHPRKELKLQDTSKGVAGGRTGKEASRSRRWILRSGVQTPLDRVVAPRQSLGTTIAV